jgi:hypothetical protein
MSRMGELSSGITMATGLGIGASNPMSGGSPDGYDRGGGTGRDKLGSMGVVGGKSMAGVTSINISSVGRMPTLPTIQAGDIPARTPKLPTNPSLGSKGAAMRSGAFNLGSNGMGLRLD